MHRNNHASFFANLLVGDAPINISAGKQPNTCWGIGSSNLWMTCGKTSDAIYDRMQINK